MREQLACEYEHELSSGVFRANETIYIELNKGLPTIWSWTPDSESGAQTTQHCTWISDLLLHVVPHKKLSFWTLLFGKKKKKLMIKLIM